MTDGTLLRGILFDDSLVMDKIMTEHTMGGMLKSDLIEGTP